MTPPPNRPPIKAPAPKNTKPGNAKKERLAKALRDNLSRRKAASPKP